MKAGLWSLVVCLACSVVAFTVSPVLALGDGWPSGVSSSGREGIGVRSSLGEGLVTPGSLTEGEQVLAGEEARRSSSEAVHAREESESKYEALGREAAESLINNVDPGLVDQLAGGPPILLAGQRITGFPTDYAVSVAGSDGSREVREGLEPVALEATPGKPVPINLGLSEVGGGFGPKTGLAPVRIPKRLSEGAALSEAGVSLTPVDEAGVALSGEGVLDGASVFYGDSENASAGVFDVDTLVKPSTFGLMMETSLRSQRSPSKLFFKVGLPAEARLEQESAGSGSLAVVEDGKTLAVILAPSAHDAEGTPVPVSMVAEADTLNLTVAHPAGAFAYPITVDPRTEYYASEWTWDKEVDKAGFHATNWHFEHPEGPLLSASENGGENGWTVHIPSNHGEHESGGMVYTTQGLSHIWDFASETSESDEGAHVETRVQLYGKGGVESFHTTPVNQSLIWNDPPYCRLKEKVGTGENCQVTPQTNNSAAYLALSNGAATGIAGENVFHSAEVAIQQEVNPEVQFDTADEMVNGHPNALYGTKTWLGPNSGALVKFTASDKGIGIEGWSSEHTNASGGWEHWSEKSMLGNGLCFGIQCPEQWTEYIGYSSGLPNGEPELGLDAWNAMYESHAKENEAESLRRHVVKVDSTKPHGITLTGLANGDEIGEGEYSLGVAATDGEGTIASAGIKSIAVAVDGREIGTPNGSCSAPTGPCTAKGEWALNGNEFGAGEHKLTVTATDNALNVETDEITLKVHHATPVSLGPGAVDPTSGEFTLGATDVSVSSPGASLTVERSYRSRRLTAGSEGPLGPQWSLSVGGQESITRLPNGNATLTATNGAQTTFTSKEGGGFTSPTGDAGLTLSEEKNGKGELTEYVLKNAGDATVTRFTSPTGPSSSLWKPTTQEGENQEGPLAAQRVRYIYQTVEGVTEAKYAVAPEPSGLSPSCISTLEKGEPLEKLAKGCRALEFKYATSTKATGENESEWGEYTGRLKQVLFEAENPTSKKMEAPVAEAEYLYDGQGRLRAEWNPQISPTLKTTYGYDAEGHVTAVSASGQQPWLLHYGTITGDANPGRLLSAIRPAAATKLGKGIALSKTALPKLSSTKPAVGTKIKVSSNGTWNTTPLSYSYQWEDCNSSGTECSAIPGAVNQSYYPAKSDEGHTLVALVSASNANGSVAASSAATSVVASGTPNNPLPEAPNPGTSAVWTVDYQIPLSGSELPSMTKAEVEKWSQVDDPVEATAIFPPAKPMGWPANEYKDATIDYLDEDGRAVNTASPSGGISTTEYNSYNDVVRTLSPDNRATALKESCESKENCKSAEFSKLLDSESTYEEKGSEPGAELLSGLGPQHTVKLATGTKVEARSHTVYNYNEGAPSEGGPYHLVTKTTQSALYSGKEEEARTVTTSYSGQENLGWKLRKPTSITTDPSGLNLTRTIVYEDSTGNVKETTMPGATGEQITEYPLSSSSGDATGLTQGPDKNVWFAEPQGNKVGKTTAAGAVTEYSTPFGSEPHGIATGSDKNLWFTDRGTSKISRTTTSGVITEYALPAGSEPLGITSGSDKNLWFTDFGTSKIGKITTSGGITEYSLPKESTPNSITSGPDGNLWFTDNITGKIGKITTSGTVTEYSLPSGTHPYGITSGPDGNLWFTEFGKGKIGKITTSGAITEYSTMSTESAPWGITPGPDGNLWFAEFGTDKVGKITTSGIITEYALPVKGSPTALTEGPDRSLWFTEGGTPSKIGNISLSSWVGNRGAHATQTIYYSAAANEAHKACGEHPEWANLPCLTQPAEQPGTSGLPNLPITTVTYNMWDEPLTTTSTVGSNTRTTTMSYDAAGRPLTSETTSTEGATLPKVTDKYSEATGQLVEQSTGTGTEAKKITSSYNTLGQLLTYTDADGNTTEYEYEPENGARLTHVNDGKGAQAYTYEETTGNLSKLVDTQGTNVLTFTGTYDIEGNLTSEGYPNAMTASYTRNATGETTGLTYEKKTHCTEKCIWFTESLTPSIHGQTLEQQSSLAKTNDSYDEAGRLTQVQETPTNEGCTTRIYGYEADTNRTSLTTYKPNAKNECATESATEEEHSYDTADRLTDSGIKYNEFSDITKLPAADAGGTELQSTFYTDGQVAEQKQGAQTIGYNLDPAGRTHETTDTGTINSTYDTHYAGPGDSPSWTIEPVSGHWTRYVPGIGGLAAIETGTTEPELQLPNLQDDIVAKASTSETATKLLSSERPTEYGVPTTSKPPKYSWLGGDLLPTELPTGVIAMGARSYIPQTGRFLQPDPIPGGSANAYTYTSGNPLNETDQTGDYVENNYSASTFAAEDNEAIEAEAAREAAARAIAEREAQIAAAIAALQAKQAAEQATINAQDRWDAEAKQFGEEHIAGGGMVEGGEEGGGGDRLSFHKGLVPECSHGESYNILSKRCEGSSGGGSPSHSGDCHGGGGVEAVLLDDCSPSGEEPRPGEFPPVWGEPGTPGPWQVPAFPGQIGEPDPGIA
jgi:RHS repeat-associated protein